MCRKMNGVKRGDGNPPGRSEAIRNWPRECWAKKGIYMVQDKGPRAFELKGNFFLGKEGGGPARR